LYVMHVSQAVNHKLKFLITADSLNKSEYVAVQIT